MPDTLTQKQTGFANDLFAEIKQCQAYKNHYNTKNMMPATIDVEASLLAGSPKITKRLAELNAEVDKKLISTKEERLKRLTQFEREDNFNKFGINRQSNLQAIDTHNKMDKLYETGQGIAQFSGPINILVLNEKTKGLLERVKGGERTTKLIENEVIEGEEIEDGQGTD